VTNLREEEELDKLYDLIDSINHITSHLEGLVGACDSLGLSDCSDKILKAVELLDDIANGDVEQSELIGAIYQIEAGLEG